MQREKLYNSHKTAFLIVGHFTFEMDGILSDQVLMLRKDNKNKKCLFFLQGKILKYFNKKEGIFHSFSSNLSYLTHIIALQNNFSVSTTKDYEKLKKQKETY